MIGMKVLTAAFGAYSNVPDFTNALSGYLERLQSDGAIIKKIHYSTAATVHTVYHSALIEYYAAEVLPPTPWDA